MMRAVVILAALSLTACGGQQSRPEPVIKVVEVKVPVDDPACAREAVAELGEAPVYPDDATGLKAAADLFERVKLLLAARELRTVREAQLHGALIACASRATPTP